MNHIERVFTTIRHKEPDKVPKGELAIAKDLMGRLLGRHIKDEFLDKIEVMKILKMDLVNVCVENIISKNPTKQEIGEDIYGRKIIKDEWGNKILSTGITIDVIEPAIKTVEDIYSFTTPALDFFTDSVNLVRKWREETDFFVFGQVMGGFAYPHYLMGFENFIMATSTDKDAVKCLVKKITTFATELAKKAVAAGAHLILIADDIGYNTGLFLSPDTMREIIFPYLAEEVSAIKRLGVPVFLHSDGNLNEILDDIVEIGFDGLQSLQPSAGMDLAMVKRRYGKKLCLMGNIDLDYVLPFGTKEEVEKAVTNAVEVASPGGGYILSTCNILTANVPVANAKAMYDTAEHYGIY